MTKNKVAKKANFAEFYLIWGAVQGWDIPDFHLKVCEFLDNYNALGLLMMPRGHGKSSILDVYNAYQFYKDPEHLILHQGATDPDAYKVSRGTAQVLEKHPLTYNRQKVRGEVQKWWVQGSTDVKHGNIYARGILSNVTGARAIEIQNDDIEVPNNIATPEAREKLRHRLSEQVHILVPNGKRLFVGTPHTYDSLYLEIQALGADCLILPMFKKEARFTSGSTSINTLFKPVYLFTGIGTHARLLQLGIDYQVAKAATGYDIQLNESFHLVDVYSDALWSERFTGEVMLDRRRECNTINEWDSQYQLHARPITDIRLDPDRLISYDYEPVISTANRQTTMMLGNNRIVSATLQFDPSSGKTKSDVSAVAVVLVDEQGRLYWHRSLALVGDVCTTDSKGQITGGQVWQLCDVIEQFKLPSIIIETNGIGGHIPAVLKSALKVRGLICAVVEKHVTTSKNKRILGAIEAPLMSGILYAHSSVLNHPEGGESVQVKQMRLFNPAITHQQDDYIDALAGAIAAEPVRIGYNTNYPTYNSQNDWRQANHISEAEFDF